MTDYQNELVMEHLDLVNWVIRTRISVPNRPLLTYDDFYAIGCEAICRAALKYQADSGEFAPFACRYIYNAIIDHCRAMNYRLQRSVDAGFEEGEVLFDLLAHTTVDFEAEVTDDSAKAALRACKEKYQGVARKGVEAIELKLQGYESVEIADLYGTTVNNVNVALMASLDLHPIPRQAKVRPVGPDVDDAALALIALSFLEGFLQKRCGVTVQDRLSIDLLGQKND